jgi:hypothetical protein
MELNEETILMYSAKRGYECYCKHTNFNSLVTGDNLPSWDKLSYNIKMAWVSAARAIINKEN